MNPLSDHSSDYALWRSIQQGDEKAFALLYDRYWSAIYTTAFTYLKDKDACTDIVHDIFLSLWKRREQLMLDTFLPYLTKAARYRVYVILNKASRGKLVYMDSLQELPTKASWDPTADKMNLSDLEQKIETALQEVPKRCREIFYLSRVQNLTISEIATLLNISKKTVTNQLTVALQHLRHVLGDLAMVILICSSEQA